MKYRFKINGVEVEEPVSWDGEEFILSRSKEYFGFENSYSLTLKFWKTGADIITEAYEEEGIEAMLNFSVEMACDDVTFTLLIAGILNCANYSYLNGEVSVMMEESSFSRTFKNRIDTEVSLYDTKNIDGGTLSVIEPIEVTLQSKTIKQFSILKQNPLILSTEIEHTFTGSPVVNVLFFPLQEGINDLKTVNEIGSLLNINVGTWTDFALAYPIFINQNPGLVSTIKVEYQLNFTIQNICVNPTRHTVNVRFSHGNTAVDNEIIIFGPLGQEIPTPNPDTLDISLSGTFYIPGTTPFVWLGITQANYQNLAGVPSPSTIRLISDPDNFVRFSSETEFPPTTSKVFKYYDALNKTLEIITGQTDSLKSDYFESGGCGDNLSITNGLSIRNMLQSDLTPFPINVSFGKLYKFLDSIFCLGMNIEYDETNSKWVVRIEPRSYYYGYSYDLTFDNVSDIEVKANLDYYYNEVSIGYQKWQLNNGQINGIDEFNTPRTYSIRNKNAKKKLDVKCGAITGGYSIEFTRRQQYLDASTKDFETDNDLFIICLNRVVQGIYAIGTTNERDELFTTVENLISPETAYNLRISPARNMNRWIRFVKISTTKADKFIKFNSGEGNTLLKSVSINSCDSVVEIDEHANFETGINGFTQSNNELFNPEIITFEKPLDFTTFALLQGNSKTPVRINCSDSKIYRGFLESVHFLPNGKNGGTGKFIFYTAPSSGAAFDNGFDEGFDSI